VSYEDTSLVVVPTSTRIWLRLPRTTFLYSRERGRVDEDTWRLTNGLQGCPHG